MRREDLFVALGMVEEKYLALCEEFRNPSLVKNREVSDMNNEKTRTNRIRKAWLIAAVIALMLLLMGSAIAALVTMRVENVKVHAVSGEKQEGGDIDKDTVFEGERVIFEEVHDEYLELADIYPQQIPEGYTMTFVSNDAPMQHRVVHYENDAGGLIKYWLYLGDPASYIEVYEIRQKTEVDVGSLAGILYEQAGNTRTLVWVDEDRGYGFALRTDDPTVDLLAMAESTADGEALEPTHSGETLKALEELGDYSPEYLPEGFEELDVQGWPLMVDSWYSYVRKWYVNKSENTKIYFEYETYRIVTADGYTDDARTACSLFIPGYHILKNEIVGQEVEVCGMFGIMTDNHIAWADPDTHKVFHLYSEDVTGQELLKVAQCVVNND